MDAPLRYGLSLAAMLAVAIGLPLGAALLRDGSVVQHTPPPSAKPDGVTAIELSAATPAIARRVEAIRGLKFKTIPRPEIVTPAQLAGVYRRQQRRPTLARDARRDETVLKMLGLLEPEADLNRILTGSADLVAGAYDPRTGKLLIVAGSALSGRAIAELTLAHELTHALDDQRFGLAGLDRLRDDRGIAAQAFVEGAATSLMVEYARRHLDLTDLLAALGDPEVVGDDSFDELPMVLQRQLLFAYLRGLALIDALRAAGGDWDLVDIGYRSRLPRSTEQVLHPGSYLRDEAPLQASIGARPGRGWVVAGSGVLGELGTAQLLESGSDADAARAAAAGWGGDRYRLWRRAGSPAGRCENDCRARFALALRWRWDRGRDGREFAGAARAFIEEGLGANPIGGGVWRSDQGAVALSGRRRSTAIALAPSPGLARRLAG